MDIYSKQKIWKLALISFAIIIAFSSLFITNNLVKELKSLVYDYKKLKEK